MLFYGPPGTGKTSTILALARQLYGPAMMGSRVLELNASDERGISVVREKVKDFARQQLTHAPPGEYTRTYPCPPFKIIVLDEADSMTQDAQSALRRTMETYSRITRFCRVCNSVSRIIDPLASRCSKFRFKSLDQGNARRRLEDIARAEHVRLAAGAVDALIACSDGDLRKAITFLQSAARLAGAVVATNGTAEEGMELDGDDQFPFGEVTPRSIEEIAGVIPEPVIDKLVEAMQPKPNRASVYPGVAACVEDMVADGWSAGQALTQVRVCSRETRRMLTTLGSCTRGSCSTSSSLVRRRTRLCSSFPKSTNGSSTAPTSIFRSSIWRYGSPESLQTSKSNGQLLFSVGVAG